MRSGSTDSKSQSPISDECVTSESYSDFVARDIKQWNDKAREDYFINRLPSGLTPRAYNLRIVSEIEMKHGLPAGSILSRQSTKAIAKARSEAVVALRNEHPDWTLMRLGRFFKRDHSTIIHYLQRAGVWKEADYGPRWSKKMAALRMAMAVGNSTEE